MLAGKNVLLGVTGGIAVYKSAMLLRMLVKAGATVDVIMTENAAEFVAPLTFQTLSGRPVHTKTFRLLDTSDIQHTSLSDRADLVIVAPATANLLGKYASGIADDLLTTTLLATNAPVLLAPAMNPRMWSHPAVAANTATLRNRGVHFIGPSRGEVACKDEGWGRMSEPEEIFESAMALTCPKKLHGKSLVITAGPTREKIDPVRYISNRSSGRMGYALARAASMMGAQVTLVSGPTALTAPMGVNLVTVETATEMLDAVLDALMGADALIMAAAVADFRPAKAEKEKQPKDAMSDSIALMKNPDIIATVAKKKGNRMIVGFAAETGDADAKALAKMKRKKLDAIVANDVAQPGIGFDTTENEVRILFTDGRTKALPRMAKTDLAFSILEVLFG